MTARLLRSDLIGPPIPDAELCHLCQQRRGTPEEPVFAYAICDVCRALLSAPRRGEVNWFAVGLWSVLIAIGLVAFAWQAKSATVIMAWPHG